MPYNADSQIAAFLQRLPVTETPGTSADEPLTIFRGALELTREQEDTLVQQALIWRESLETEHGRDTANLEDPSFVLEEGGSVMDAEALKPLAQKQLWDLVYRQKFDWRRRLVGGIYAEGQNVHVPLTRRVVQQMVARAQNYFFQTEPWCSAVPVGLDDIDTAKAANEWAQYRFRKARLKATLEKAIELAFIRGETILKTQRVERNDYYESYETVAVDESGQPIMAEDGDYIFETDEFAEQEGVGLVLVRDGRTLLPVWPLQFAETKIRRKNTLYAGPEARILNYRDFLFPLNSPDLQQAECIMEDYEIPAIEIVEQYIERLQKRGAWDDKEYPRVLEMLYDASAGSPVGNSAASKARPELGEPGDTPMAGRGDPVVNVAEFHMWVDANNDGQRENVVLMLDLDTERPILIDYVANVYEGGIRPYHNIRINPVDGRATGESMVGILWQLQKFGDLTFARWDMSVSRSGKFICWNPEMTVEGQTNPNLLLNGGQVYRKTDPRSKASDIVDVVDLYEFKGAQLENLLQLVMQLMTNMTGVANANDAAMAGLDTGKLATGVRNIDRSGQEQFAPLLSHLSEGIEAVTEAALQICIRTADEKEMFEVLGPDGAMLLKNIAATDLKRFSWSLSLEMTRYKAEQEVQQSQASVQAALSYYSLPPALQIRLAPLFRQQLKNFGVRNADAIIALPTEADLLAAQAAGQQTGAVAAGPAAAPQQSLT